MSKKATKQQTFVHTVVNGCYAKGIVYIDFTNESVKDDDFIEKFGVDAVVREYTVPDRDLAHTRNLFLENIQDEEKYALHLYSFGIKNIDTKIKEVFGIKKSKIVYKLKKEKKVAEPKESSAESESEDDKPAPKATKTKSKKEEKAEEPAPKKEAKATPAKKVNKKKETERVPTPVKDDSDSDSDSDSD